MCAKQRVIVPTSENLVLVKVNHQPCIESHIGESNRSYEAERRKF